MADLSTSGVRMAHKYSVQGTPLSSMSTVMPAFAAFDADEIKRLGKRFKKLDLDNSGSLSVEEFMSLPELQQNPLVQRVIEIFDTDGNGEVDFKEAGDEQIPIEEKLWLRRIWICCSLGVPEFIEGVSQFSVKGDKEQKLRFAFRIYDMDKDGYISNGELFQVLKMMVGSNLKDTQLQQIVDKTIINADRDGDGRISFEEFCANGERRMSNLLLSSGCRRSGHPQEDGGGRVSLRRLPSPSSQCSVSGSLHAPGAGELKHWLFTCMSAAADPACLQSPASLEVLHGSFLIEVIRFLLLTPSAMFCNGELVLELGERNSFITFQNNYIKR
ncbi:hypothetical protein DNTS_031000 [Danionella cerebrum]|uniref:EF-hand domain-containing protein n=1 Tax=Danionella cerebrum TaxID=2873325 RepID=A0A553PVC5_9TELE|nr:hypothetical protein DNTS_031000 [Danionella translucida]